MTITRQPTTYIDYLTCGFEGMDQAALPLGAFMACYPLIRRMSIGLGIPLNIDDNSPRRKG